MPGLLRRPLPLPVRRPVTGRAERPLVTLRRGGVDVGTDDLDVRWPHATGRLVVLVPPPGRDEQVWTHDPGAPSYASQLARLLDWSPVHLRIGAASATDLAPTLSALLQRLVDGWPVPVEQVALVGLGDGGLVLRAACGARPVAARAWPDLVSHVIALGTPHLVVRAGRTGTPVGRELDRRWAGIVTEERAAPGLTPLSGATYAVVSAAPALPRPAGRAIGGLLWWRHALPGRPRRAQPLFPTAERFEVAGGPSLAQHPEVAAALLDWLR